MSVMLRSVGVPSRVVAGYATGEFDDRSQSFIVRENDAHSWPEVFFPTYGWVEFEPTPVKATIAHGEEEPQTDTTIGAGIGDEEDYSDEAILFEGPSLWVRLLWGGLIAAFLALLAVSAARYLQWRWLSKLSYEGQVYEKMCRLAVPAGLGPKPYQTPGEYARSLANELPDHENEIGTIVGSYVKSTYTGHSLGDEERQATGKAWLHLRKRLWKRVIRRR